MQPKADAMDKDLTEQATRLLDRVQFMRVFDFAGVVEAIGEIGRMWDNDDQLIAGLELSEMKGGRQVVNDSQDEEDLSDDSAEMKASDGPVRGNAPDTQDGQVGMVVVDTISNVVSSIVSQNQIQGISCPELLFDHPSRFAYIQIC